MNASRKLSRFIPVSAAALIALAGFSIAGPLNPPAGSITSTMKTMTEVEPRIAINATNTAGDADSVFRITAPGSYYLTGNLYGAVGKSGIEIATDSVTIDLNGFSILGTASSLSGIAAPARNNIHIKNGTIRGWSAKGVELLSGYDNRATDLTIESNVSTGLEIGISGRVDRVIARGNSIGIDAASSSIITGSIAIANVTGMSIGAHSLARDCQAADNSQDGFYEIGTGPIFENCVAMSNGGDGFNTSSHARIERCVSRFNTGHGIVIDDESTVLHNMCDNNGVLGTGAGIYADANASRCRIEGNTCTSSDYGIKVDGTSNLIIANRCSINTSNFEIVSGNRVGTIVVMPTSGATGNAGGNTGTADSLANLAF